MKHTRDLEKMQAVQEATNLCNQPSTLVDRLREKRARVSREMTIKIRGLDRQITLLESSQAEEIVKEAEETLYSD